MKNNDSNCTKMDDDDEEEIDCLHNYIKCSCCIFCIIFFIFL